MKILFLGKCNYNNNLSNYHHNILLYIAILVVCIFKKTIFLIYYNIVKIKSLLSFFHIPIKIPLKVLI